MSASGRHIKEQSAFPIVGIGASAGGLEAVTELLHHLPPDTGLAYVLVQHLAPGHKSVLAEILARETSMTVVEATDALPVAPDTVYVIPAGQDLTIERSMLQLNTRPASGHHLPIDSFFASLALDRGDRAIAVVLSGTASDGAAGVRAVKASGGLTIAQDPATAKYRSMPENAIATGAIDLVLPTPMIAARLAAVHRPAASGARVADIPAAPETALAPETPPVASGDDPVLSDLLALVRAATEVDFSHYKQNTLLRRIGRRMMLHHVQDLEEYVRLLRSDRSEVEALYQDILIHVTSFFRQPRVFDALKQKSFPEIAEAKAGGQVRFWVPGCASGEEAYSLAIAWAEFVGTGDPGGLPFTVFATDINQQVIDKARAGVYPQSIASDVSPERLERFFSPVEGGYRVVKSLRDACVFSKHDLTRDPPFSRLDLVSLRNVLIYLGPLLQHRVMPLLHFSLLPRAFLLLGESESIGAFTHLFALVDKKAKIYVRRESVIAAAPALPFATGGGRAVVSPDASPPEFDLAREADRIVLDDYAPIGVIVDADLQIRQFRGSTNPYLQLAAGRASFDLVRMAREGLAGELRSALREVAKNGGVPVHREDIRILRDGDVAAVGFSVIPMKSPTGESSFLNLFRATPRARGERPPVKPAGPPQTADETTRNVAQLERELGEMREYARSVLEDKESANEELRSANEELQSANEELQSVNEELETTSEEVQSANEELQTLNDELRAVNEALDQRELENQIARDFARAVVDTVREPLLVLDAELRVVSANRSFYRTFQTTAEDSEGQSFFHLDGGQWDIPAVRDAVSRVVAAKRDFQDLVVERDFVGLGPRAMLLSGRHIRAGALGPRDSILLAVDDITERRRAEALSGALDEVNLTMISTLDYREILEGVLLKAAEALGCDQADLAVPEEGSWVAGYSLRWPELRLGTWAPDESVLASSAPTKGQTISTNGAKVQVPLRARGEVVGVLSFGRTGPRAAFSAAELDFVHKLAPALALALENANLFSTERRVAQVLQANLLGSVSAPPHVEVGVAYRPAHEAERVGGDFYDLFALEGGLVAVVVGDVSGKGVEAASLTGTVRAILRAFASLGSSPSSLLAKANELLLTQVPSEVFVTVLVMIVDPATGKVTVSSAGHPRAAVCGGETRFLDVIPGTPLGAMSSTYHEAVFNFASGETLILFTDGLIEARRGSDFFGEEGVAGALAGQDCGDAQAVVDTLVSSVTQFAGGRLEDDLAVIAVRIPVGPA
ncbi:MAG: chemotaxis protein CheB [Thermoleophilia bacterium]